MGLAYEGLDLVTGQKRSSDASLDAIHVTVSEAKGQVSSIVSHLSPYVPSIFSLSHGFDDFYSPIGKR